MVGGTDIIKSRGVSLLCLSYYSTEYTINDALRASCTDGEWSSSKDRGITYMSFVGTTTGGNRLVLMLQKDESDYCRVTSIEIDGENYTWYMDELLELMYDNIERD